MKANDLKTNKIKDQKGDIPPKNITILKKAPFQMSSLSKSPSFLGLLGFAIAFLLLGGCKKFDDDVISPKPSDSTSSQINAHNPEEAFPGKKGILKKGYLFGELIEYEEINGRY